MAKLRQCNSLSFFLFIYLFIILVQLSFYFIFTIFTFITYSRSLRKWGRKLNYIYIYIYIKIIFLNPLMGSYKSWSTEKGTWLFLQ